MPYILFDIGANNGQDSLDRTKSNPDIITYAFEPIPELFNRIDTARKNGYVWEHYRKSVPMGDPYDSRYHLFPYALNNFNGFANFYIADSDTTGDWGVSGLYQFVDDVNLNWPGRSDLKTTRTITVEVKRFDTWYEEQKLNLDKIDFFHCDTQGSDLRVLEGMGDYIELIQQGVVECARDEQAKLYAENHTKDEMIEFLHSRGFEIVNIQSNDQWGNELNLYFQKR